MPTRRLDTYFYHHALDVEKMQEAAQYLVGEHDFKSFCANRRMKKSTVRRIDEIRIVEHGTKLEFLYTGNGFLYNMVRAITGTVLYAAEGKFLPEDIPAILESRDRTLAGPTVPPGGLYLTRLWYEDERLNG